MTVLSVIAVVCLVWVAVLTYIVYVYSKMRDDEMRKVRLRIEGCEQAYSSRRLCAIEELLQDLGNDLALYEERLDKLEENDQTKPKPKPKPKPKKPPVKRATKQAKPARKVQRE